jgi:cyclopropane-fatty-acyl-phospholipid synthase
VNLVRGIFRRRLRALRHGRIVIDEDRGGREQFGQPTATCPLTVTIRVHDRSFYSEAALGGSIGAAEAYMDGLWSTDDLTGLVRIIACNSELNSGIERGVARMAAPLQKFLHWCRRNTRPGSRKNIARHYDLGNDLFEAFLDPTMMYSCAIFPDENSSLEEASIHKMDVICRKLDLSPQDELLEIGTGWGGLAIHAARNYGCKVTTTTISREQRDLAQERIREAGLEQRIAVLLEDYRDLPQRLERRFSKLVSVEMIEAVGERYLDKYFQTCSRLLEPDGVMLLQSIVIADSLYDSYRRSVDFIQRYIFPGGFLPSVEAMRDSISRVTDFSLADLHEITPHYATTLQRWRRNFFDKIDHIRELGYDDRFIRMWEYYLCYCEGGFRERTIGDYQLLLTKPLRS